MGVNFFMLVFFLIIIGKKEVIYVVIKAIYIKGGKVLRNVISI